MSIHGEVIQASVNSKDVKEVTFVPPRTIYVVPKQGLFVYQYKGHKELFETVAYAPSVGIAWREYLCKPLLDIDERAIELSLNDYEEAISLASFTKPTNIQFKASSVYAW